MSWTYPDSPFRSRCVGMHLDMAGVDHLTFIIRLIDLNFQELFPNTFSTPTDEPLMNAAPLPVIGRQVTPGCSGSQYLKHCVNKTAVILSNPTPLASLSWQMWSKQLPYFVVYVVSVIGCFHLAVPCLFKIVPFYHNTCLLGRRYLTIRAEYYKNDSSGDARTGEIFG